MTLANMTYSYNGLVFGDNCPIMVDKAQGFEGFDVRNSDSNLPRGDGAIRGLDYVNPRAISFDLVVVEPGDVDGTTYEALWASLRSTFAPSQSQDRPLVFKRPGQPERQIFCRPISLVRVEQYTSFNRVSKPPVVLQAADPRIYSTTLHSQLVPLYAAVSGGLDFPVDFPVDFVGGTQTTTVVTNSGTANAYPLIQFYGPKTGTCTAVSLINDTTGASVTINTTLVTGDVCMADMGAAVTAANSLIISTGGSSRYGSWALPRTPLALAPGSNTLRFQVTGSSTDCACTVGWRDTWLD
jgi:hypothetical protein